MVTKSGRSGCADCWISLIVAALLFALVFADPALGFWRQLAVTATLLAMMAFLFDRTALKVRLRPQWPGTLRAVAGGLAAATVLYGIFLVGRLAVSAFFPSGGVLIRSIYQLGRDEHAWRIGLVLLLVVGPCEELFWRGYIQRRLTDVYGPWGVGMTICAYAAVHLASGNPVLILAALVCGAFWGVLFRVFGNIVANIVSHAVWASVVFAFLPLA